MKIDESNMYIAPLPVVSAAEDRDGEITDPEGLVVQSYENTRPVYYNHSHFYSPLEPPIGTCETPDRKFDLHKTSDGWSGGTRFSQTTKLGNQIFASVVDGLIRGRSVSGIDIFVEPYTPQVPSQTLHEGRVVNKRPITQKHLKWEMIEFSWTPMPANRDMVTMYKSLLSRDRIQGERLDPTFRKSLEMLDLSNPRQGVASTSKHNTGAFQKGFGRAFGKSTGSSPGGTFGKSVSRGLKMSNTPVAAVFDSSDWSLQQVQSVVSAHPDLFPEDSITVTEGGKFFKSQLVPYKGDTYEVSDANYPGMKLQFAKGSFFNKGDDTEEAEQGSTEEVAPAGEEDAVKKIVQEATGGVHVEDPNAEPGQVEKTATVPEEGAADPQAEEKPEGGPLGNQWYKQMNNLMKQAMEQGQAATGELEPDVVAEISDEVIPMMQACVAKMAELSGARYGQTETPEPTEETEEAPADESAAVLKKSVDADLFWGRRYQAPEGVRATLGSMLMMVPESDASEELKTFAKSIVPSRVRRVDEPDTAAKALAEATRRWLKS